MKLYVQTSQETCQAETEEKENLAQKLDANVYRVLQKKRDFTEETNLTTLEEDIIGNAYEKDKQNGDLEDLFQAVHDSNDLPTIGKFSGFIHLLL